MEHDCHAIQVQPKTRSDDPIQLTHRLRVELILQTQSVRTIWPLFVGLDGRFFAPTFRGSLRAFLRAFDELQKLDKRILTASRLGLRRTNIKQMISTLRTWSEERGKNNPFPADGSRDRIYQIFVSLGKFLARELGVRFPPPPLAPLLARAFKQRTQWLSHLPQGSFVGFPTMVMQQASTFPTIALVGDIRRSQDLMTYAVRADDFRSRMAEFLDVTRRLLDRHNAIFDKFTGDGFIAYFNKSISENCASDLFGDFLAFLHEYMLFSRSHFRKWTKTVEKVPGEKSGSGTGIGLALGADLGLVSFHMERGHFVALGTPVVWAARMADSAGPNEALVNNLLYEELRSRNNLRFKEKHALTKSGEPFLARRLSFKWSANEGQYSDGKTRKTS